METVDDALAFQFFIRWSTLLGVVVLARTVDGEQLCRFPEGKPYMLSLRKALENTFSRSPVQVFPQIFFSTSPPAW